MIDSARNNEELVPSFVLSGLEWLYSGKFWSFFGVYVLRNLDREMSGNAENPIVAAIAARSVHDII